jgi:hypothetical protein
MNDLVILDDEDVRTGVGGDGGQRRRARDSREDGRTLSRALRHLLPAEYYFLLPSGELGSYPRRTRVSKALAAKDADSFATKLNMTPLGLSGIFGVAVSRSDAASGFDRRQSISSVQNAPKPTGI